MKFVNYATYIADADKVSRIRPEHVAYLREVYARGQLVASGPFTDGSGGLFVFEAGSLEEADALVRADPFCTAGVFADWRLAPWRLLAANPELLKVEAV